MYVLRTFNVHMRQTYDSYGDFCDISFRTYRINLVFIISGLGFKFWIESVVRLYPGSYIRSYIG